MAYKPAGPPTRKDSPVFFTGDSGDRGDQNSQVPEISQTAVTTRSPLGHHQSPPKSAWSPQSPVKKGGESIGAADPFRDPDIIATMLDHDEPVAVLINSKVLGARVWFALREDWKPEPEVKTPVFYPSELPALRTKTPEQLRSIFNVKRAFNGGKVVQ